MNVPAPSEPQPSGGTPQQRYWQNGVLVGVPSEDTGHQPRLPSAGWFPNPENPAQQRYWDGAQWTERTFSREDAMRAQVESARAELRQWGKRGRLGVLTMAVAYSVNILVMAFLLLPRMYDMFDKMLAPGAGKPMPVPSADPGYMVGNLLGNAVSLAGLVGLIVLLIWQYKAAVYAKNVGIPSSMEPGWGVAGWLIPIGNLFMPYMALKGLTPVGDEGRRYVVFAWTGWIVAMVGTMATLALGMFAGSGWAFLAVVVTLAGYACFGWFMAKLIARFGVLLDAPAV